MLNILLLICRMWQSFNRFAEEVNAWRTAFNAGEMDFNMEDDQGDDLSAQ